MHTECSTDEGAQRSYHPRRLRRLQCKLRRLLIVPPLKRTFHVRHDLNLTFRPLDPPRFLLVKQHLFDFSHLDPDPNTHRYRDQEYNTKQDRLDHAIVAVLYQEHTQINKEDLLRQTKQRSHNKMPKLYIARRKHRSRKVRRDRTQPYN